MIHRHVFPSVRAAMEKRVSSLTDPRWVEAISTLIYYSQDRYFRWHDSGDLQDIEHLRKIIQVCKNCYDHSSLVAKKRKR